MKNSQSLTKFHLLEINLISAQELKLPRFSLPKNQHIYAVVWIDPKQKLRSRVKAEWSGNPTWNDKFVFMVDATMLDSWSTAQLVFEFYCVRRFGKDPLIGTSRVLLGSLKNYCSSCYCEGMPGTFRAFHVRRPNGDPQGILNIGIMILDGLHSQVICDQFMEKASAVDYKFMTGRTSGAGERDCTFAVWRWLFRSLVLRRKMNDVQKKVPQCPD